MQRCFTYAFCAPACPDSTAPTPQTRGGDAASQTSQTGRQAGPPLRAHQRKRLAGVGSAATQTQMQPRRLRTARTGPAAARPCSPQRTLRAGRIRRRTGPRSQARTKQAAGFRARIFLQRNDHFRITVRGLLQPNSEGISREAPNGASQRTPNVNTKCVCEHSRWAASAANVGHGSMQKGQSNRGLNSV